MSDRHSRLVSVLQELAARYVQQEANTDPLITITHADVTSDQKQVTIYFTTIPENKQQDAHVFLKRNGKEFRTFVKEHARLKIIPHIDFEVDYGERHRQHIDDIVRDLDNGKEV